MNLKLQTMKRMKREREKAKNRKVAEVKKEGNIDRKKTTKLRKTNSKRVLFDDEDDQEVIEYFYCNESFSASRSQEQWIQCQICPFWVHE